MKRNILPHLAPTRLKHTHQQTIKQPVPSASREKCTMPLVSSSHHPTCQRPCDRGKLIRGNSNSHSANTPSQSKVRLSTKQATVQNSKTSSPPTHPHPPEHPLWKRLMHNSAQRGKRQTKIYHEETNQYRENTTKDFPIKWNKQANDRMFHIYDI